MVLFEMATRVAVIGSNSFSGSDFIDLLLDRPGCEVLAISRGAQKSELFLPYLRHRERVRFAQLDLNRDRAQIVAELDRFAPSWIVNFAAQSEVAPSWEAPEHWFETNVVALAALTNQLRRRPYLERFVQVSSPEVYGNCQGPVTEAARLTPSTPYAASKAAADLLLATLVKHCDFPLLTVRATNVYGAHQQLWKIVPRAVISIKQGKKIPLHGGGQAVKSFIHVRDVSRGELAIMERGRVGQLYHLSPGHQGYAVRDVVARICRLMGVDFDRSVEPINERLGQDAAYVVDSNRARAELGWQPTVELNQGLAEVIDWIEENWQQIGREPHEYVHRA
jgi:dTDP-glucose 4,6-dehydratase